MIVRPARLRRGDVVAVPSPSWGGPHLFPDVFDAGVATLRRFGLDVREMPGTRRSAGELRADPVARADDLNAAFADPDVAAVVATIGGDDAVRLLPHLDEEVIATNPKILMGYSDTVALLLAVHRLGLVTFHGPAVMAGLAQARHFPQLEAHLREMLFEPQETVEYRPYPAWVGSYRDWATTDDPTAIGDLVPHDGWRWLNGTTVGRGRLVGGCFEVLEMLKGTRWWPDVAWWDGRILFLETSEEVPTVDQVRRWLVNDGVQGIFGRLSGLLIGRARGYDDARRRELDEMVRSVVVDEFGAVDLPIVTGMDVGHTDPQWVLPLGVLAELDPAAGTFRLLEPAVR